MFKEKNGGAGDIAQLVQSLPRMLEYLELVPATTGFGSAFLYHKFEAILDFVRCSRPGWSACLSCQRGRLHPKVEITAVGS